MFIVLGRCLLLLRFCFVDYILGTVHKSKGLEFDTVVVTDDFVKVPCARHNLQRMNINLGSYCFSVVLRRCVYGRVLSLSVVKFSNLIGQMTNPKYGL